MNANNTKNTTTMSTIYWSLLGVLMTFACLIAVDVISPQNVFIIAAAVISVIGVIERQKTMRAGSDAGPF